MLPFFLIFEGRKPQARELVILSEPMLEKLDRVKVKYGLIEN